MQNLVFVGCASSGLSVSVSFSELSSCLTLHPVRLRNVPNGLFL